MRRVLLGLYLVTACTVDVQQVEVPAEGGLKKGDNGSVSLDTNQVPVLPECAPGSLVRRTSTGWDCVSPPPELHTHTWNEIQGKPDIEALARRVTALEEERLALLERVVPPGTIEAYGGATPPLGFLPCDGTAVSRETYPALFASIGTSFGSGDNSKTFNLPDLRGRFLRGVDGGAGNDPDKATRTAMNPGGLPGNNVGSVQDDRFQGHRHTAAGETSARAAGVNIGWGIAAGTYNFADGVGDPKTDGTHGDPRTSSETRPKNAYVNFIIKY